MPSGIWFCKIKPRAGSVSRHQTAAQKWKDVKDTFMLLTCIHILTSLSHKFIWLGFSSNVWNKKQETSQKYKIPWLRNNRVKICIAVVDFPQNKVQVSNLGHLLLLLIQMHLQDPRQRWMHPLGECGRWRTWIRWRGLWRWCSAVGHTAHYQWLP